MLLAHLLLLAVSDLKSKILTKLSMRSYFSNIKTAQSFALCQTLRSSNFPSYFISFSFQFCSSVLFISVAHPFTVNLDREPFTIHYSLFTIHC